MSSGNRSKGKKKSKANAKNKNKKQSNSKNKNKNKKNTNSTATTKISEIAERKYQSDEEDDEYFKSEHYLKINKKSRSKAKFTTIDCLSSQDIIPLKQEAMKNPRNKKLKEKMMNEIRHKYKQWLIELKSGFNLLFYGVGSKKHILEDFGVTYCCNDPDGIVIRVNGFDDTINIKQIVDALVKVIIDKDKKRKSKKNTIKSSPNMQQRAVNIVNYLEDNENNLIYKYYYLIIHNIDGKVLRKNKIQRIFSILANCAYIHLIASVDHIHSLLLWDRNHLSNFHWIYHEITTYKHYFQETEFEKDKTIKLSTTNQQNHGLEHIMSSLTPQHVDIIRILAENQNENNGVGLDEDEWYCLCEDKLIVHSDLKFRQYIVEFLDHNVIVENLERGNTNSTIYTIPYDKDIIQTHLIDFEINDD